MCVRQKGWWWEWSMNKSFFCQFHPQHAVWWRKVLIHPPTLTSTTQCNKFTPLPLGLSKGFLGNVGKHKANKWTSYCSCDIIQASLERVDVRDLVLTCSGEWTQSVRRQTAACWSLECHLSGGEWLPLETGTCNTQRAESRFLHWATSGPLLGEEGKIWCCGCHASMQK